MPAHSVEELAAQLGRPPSALAGLRGLTPAQIALLSTAIEEARERGRSGLTAALPPLARGPVATALRWRKVTES